MNGREKALNDLDSALNSKGNIIDAEFEHIDDDVDFTPKKEIENTENFKTPEAVLRYLDELIKNGRPLKWFRLDIADDTSLEEVLKKINIEFINRNLNHEERDHLFAILYTKKEALTESEDERLNDLFDIFNFKPFTATDYYLSTGIKNASRDNINQTTRDFDKFVSYGILEKKFDGSYQFIPWQEDVVENNIEKENKEDLTSSIKNAKSFDELYEILRKEGGIQGSVNYTDAEKIIRNIEYFRKIDDFNPEFITRSNGLRDKVEELKKQSQLSVEKNSPEPRFIDRIRAEREAEEKKVGSSDEKPKAKPEDLPEKELETEEQINEQLSKARSEYASALVDYKNTIREKKKWWQKVIDELSFEKPMPEVGKPQELLDAEKAYMEAKKKKAKSLFGKDEIREYKGKTNEVLSLKEGEQFLFNSKLVEQAEEEYRILQKRISENSPPLEKKILARNFEKWTQLPTWQRVAYSSSLITIAGVAFGSVALGGAIATFAYRTARSLAGAGIGQAVGKAYGEVLKERAEKRTEKAGQEYGRDINLDNFEEKERKLAEFYEKEESQRKKDFLKKAGLMAVAGAATNIGLEFTTKGLMDVSGVSKSSGNISEGRSGAKISPEGSRVRPEVGRDVIPQKGGGIKVEPVKVELSSKGFIKTFEDMKGQLKAKYPDEAKMPKGVKDFMETDNTKLAQKYGFYDPNKNLSGMGFKGESLSLDEKGELHYNHLDGKSDIIDTADHKFAGKMFKPEDLTESKVTPKAPGADLMSERQVETPDLQEPSDSIVNPNSGVESLRVESQNVPPSIENSFDLKIDSKQFHVDFVKDGINKPAIMVDNVKIAEQVPYPYGQNGNMMQLLDKYQDGKKYAPLRQAFIEAQNKELGLIKGSSKFIEAQNVASTPFESGQIDIVRGIGGNKNSVEVLLNGKKIAEGLLTEKGPKVKIFSNLKGGIFLADTVYERAFKVASKTLKGIKFVK